MTASHRGNSSFQLLTIVTLLAFMWAFLPPHEAIAQQQVRVPAGTQVLLRTTETLAPETLHVGDTVHLSVVSDVKVQGRVVIEAGAPALGEITESKKQNFIGIAGKLGLAVRSVEAVDGTTIALHGSKLVEGEDKMVISIGLALVCCILFGLMKGGEASLASGTQIQATVAATTEVIGQ